MRIIIVTPVLPIPARSGAEIRVLSVATALSNRHEVELLTSEPQGADHSAREKAKRLFVACHYAPKIKRSRIARVAGAFFRLLRGEPLATTYFTSKALKALLKRVTRERRYDVVAIEHTEMSKYVSAVDACFSPVKLLTMHNIVSLQYHRRFEVESSFGGKMRALLTSVPMRSWEVRMANRFDVVAVMSHVDEGLLTPRLKRPKIVVVPNGVDTYRTMVANMGTRKEVIAFVGAMDYAPNMDAVLWFARSVFPQVRSARPLEFWIIGRNPPKEVTALSAIDGVKVIGEVEDVKPLYAEAKISVVPLRSGGGTRLKILEAMATGTPVVSTSMGAEGIEAVDNEHLLIADTPDGLCEQILRLDEDEQLWSTISRNGRALVEQSYSWSRIVQQLEDALQSHVRDRTVRA
jgi:glycosyltransferase involved in cell wall biosynthesis